jgi:Protein of unknown function (DUF3644)
MPRSLPRVASSNLDKCRAAAVAAVDVYNRPGSRFGTPHFIVLAIIAWTAYFHALFYKRRIRPWYKKPGRSTRGDRYLRIDGDPRHWDLSECLKQHFGGNNPPERRNLEFLIGLRNKIEHRDLPNLDAGLYGECQAALLNLEEFLVNEFGDRYALAESLAVSLQFSHIIPTEKKKAAKALAAKEAKGVREYVERFRAGLPSSTLNSTKYSFNVFLVPKVANKKDLADVAVEFIKIDDSNKDELDRLEKLNVLIKEKHIPISNLGLFKPTQVVAAVSARLPGRFTMGGHTAAWHRHKVRPGARSAKPDATDSRYCVYDAVHNDYVYTRAWIDKLVAELTPTA